MIPRALVVLFCAVICLLPAQTVSHRAKRDKPTYSAPSGGGGGGGGYKSTSVKDRLDNQIHYLLNDLPGKIDEAKYAIESDITRSNFESITEGWAIILASWFDIYSDWVINNRTLGLNFGGRDTLYNYGGLASYGVGFGAPLLLGLPDETLSCDSYSFRQIVDKYGLSHGIPDYPDASLESKIGEFDLLVNAKLDCIVGKEDDYEEAAEVVWALEELLAALNLRLELEGGYSSGHHIGGSTYGGYSLVA